MAMNGAYGDGSRALPRVVVVSISRFHEALPRPDEVLEFLVSIHEEGRGSTWKRNAVVRKETETVLLAASELRKDPSAIGVHGLHGELESWGRALYATFIGEEGARYLERLQPTSLLLEVDETIMNLPWELLADERGPLAQRYPMGRLVSTRVLPRPGRNPLEEDRVVRILAVANPTGDLAAASSVLQTLDGLVGNVVVDLELTVLDRAEATRERFRREVEQGDFDLIHFAGHGRFEGNHPGDSGLRLADGDLTSDDILDLAWKEPPYFVFGSACESAMARPGQRLVSDEDHSNGIAAAFLAAGVEAYAGFWWSVGDDAAAAFASTFYRLLFWEQNFGLAFLGAREEVFRTHGPWGELTPFCAVLYGDAAGSERRDLAQVRAPDPDDER